MESTKKGMLELEKEFKKALSEKQAFVAYATAGSTEIISYASPHFYFLDILPVEIKEGFLFHPFDAGSNNPIVWIAREASDKYPSKQLQQSLSMQNLNHDEEKFIDFVKVIQENIGQGTILKAIASRPKFVDAPKNWDLLKYFGRLAEKYASAFTYLIHIPNLGTWTGATPELLVRKNAEQLEMVSLAGTKTDTQEWTEKEYNEQQIVTDFITESIKQNAFENIEVSAAETSSAGAIQHLKSTITFTSSSNDAISRLIRTMHPTPAVGGIPQRNAVELIRRFENYDRRYYTGFLGPINESGLSELFVNLRCLEVMDDSLCLYVGAGITAGSEPQKEWAETELKAQTLLSLLDE